MELNPDIVRQYERALQELVMDCDLVAQAIWQEFWRSDNHSTWEDLIEETLSCNSEFAERWKQRVILNRLTE